MPTITVTVTITIKELHKYTNPLHPDYALLEQAATKISKQLSEYVYFLFDNTARPRCNALADRAICAVVVNRHQTERGDR